MNTLFLGTFISSESLNELKVIDGYIVVQNGKITSLGHQDDLIKFKQENDLKEYKLVQLKADQFLIPGFIDCHVHAPQFPNCGMGLDKPLLEWLKLYTFPLEKKYSDTKFAAEVYNNVVRRLLKNGTTTACYFGSLHLDASLILAKTVVTLNQRALVGKVSMNMKNDADYYNETEVELRDTETFLKGVYQLKVHYMCCHCFQSAGGAARSEWDPRRRAKAPAAGALMRPPGAKLPAPPRAVHATPGTPPSTYTPLQQTHAN